jgi:hypothetical protein
MNCKTGDNMRFIGIVLVMFCTQAFSQNDTSQCFPKCRAGFICHNGQCISLCNPPCPEGMLCTSDMTCVPASSAIILGDKVLKPNPYPDRQGMIVTGAVFTAISAAMAVFAVVGGNGGIKDADPGTTGWVAGACSGACLSIGVPVFVGGVRKQMRHNRWERERVRLNK